MRVLNTLGRQYVSTVSPQKQRMGLCECPSCGERAIRRIVKNMPKTCKPCSYKNRRILGGISKTPLYAVYRSMLDRVGKPNNPAYSIYGGRGITVCKDWRDSVEAFFLWANSTGYSLGLQLDRVNTDLGYYPSNCRWVGVFTQAQNQRLKQANNTTGYRGVTRRKNGKYQANITAFKKAHHLGTHPTAQAAARAYDGYVLNHPECHHPLNFKYFN